MGHGIVLHQIMVNGWATPPRQELMELYCAIEEAKADVLGLYMLQHFFQRGYLKHDEKKLYTTFLASSFRTLRFGLNEAHGKGMALQFNYLTDKGAFVHNGNTWEVNQEKIGGGIRDLPHDLLTMKPAGIMQGRNECWIRSVCVLRPEMKATLNRVRGVPVDIRPIFETADQISRPK